MVKSKLPRKQRKYLYTAPLHLKRKMICAHLDGKLIEKYNVRSMPVRKGDTVRIIRGDVDVKGHEGKVASVDTKAMRITIDGVTIAKADGTQTGRPIHPSNVLLTKLDLSDKWRRKNIEQRGKVKVEVKEEEELKKEEVELEKSEPEAELEESKVEEDLKDRVGSEEDEKDFEELETNEEEDGDEQTS